MEVESKTVDKKLRREIKKKLISVERSEVQNGLDAKTNIVVGVGY